MVWHFLLNSKYTSRNHFQSVQQATEWQNAVGSTGLSVIGDFMDPMDFDNTEAHQNAMNNLLEHDQYVYLKTKDVEENGKLVVCDIYSYAKGIQVKQAGHYCGPLIIFMMAQCWLDLKALLRCPVSFPLTSSCLLCLLSVPLWWATLVCTKINYSQSTGTLCSLALGQQIHH